MLHHPNDALEKFEEVSRLVKHTHLKIKDPHWDSEISKLILKENNPEKVTFLKKCFGMIGESMQDISAEDKKLLSRGKPCSLPNLEEEASMFEWAGISFGEEEIYLLQKALKKLAILSGALKLKFWGKIYGTEKDYWIVEGALEKGEEALTNVIHEKRGEGVNKLVYWVTDSLLEDWI